MELFELLSFDTGGWGSQLAAGVSLTIALALTTLPLGLALGLLLALMINSQNRWASSFATTFVTIFRALPELLTLFLIYYGGQILLQKISNFLFGQNYIEISAFAAGVIALGVVFASFASEVFVAGLRAIPKGQHEAALSMGFSRFYKFTKIIAPQLWRFTLPGLGNLWFVLLKDTSLVSIISLTDLMRQTQLAVAATKEPLFFYAVACLVYLVISLFSSLGVSFLERRSNRGVAS